MSRAFVIVGSSRGFGRAILEICLGRIRELDDGRTGLFFLITTSRSKSIAAFNEAFKSVMGLEYNGSTNRDINVIVEETNLFDTDACLRSQELLSVALTKHHNPVSKLYVFLNAGSVDPVGPVITKTNSPQGILASHKHYIDAVQHHIILNFVSFVSIMRSILQDSIRRTREHPHLIPYIRIVNVSSLAAIRELYGMAIYSAIKSARESFCRSCALELSRDYPQVDCKILSYAPGPMDTDLVRHGLLDPSVAENEVRLGGHPFVDPLQSADKCVRLLVEDDDKWSSGDHLDFYDF
jgi:NAD(P)-dependent dehydrogenase (short-subunit alcohol dehydrogenase family)